MFHQIIIYLLVFTFVACLGYQKLSNYAEYQKESVGGAVFQLAPREEVKVNGAVGKQNIIYQNLFELRGDDESGHYHAGGLVICVGFPEQSQTYNRLSIRIKPHGIIGDDIELDEFVVTECKKDNLEKMFEVSKVETNVYTITFKDSDNQCFKREIQVIDEELSLTVGRKEPVQLKCSEISGIDQTRSSYVTPKSWMDNGELFDLRSIKASNVALPGFLEDNAKTSTSVRCSLVMFEQQRYNVVDILYRGIPIDRLIAQSCLTFLDKSIYIEKEKRGTPDVLYVNYLNTKDVCLRRKYEVSVQPVESDAVLQRVTVKRSTPKKTTCVALKLSCMSYRAYKKSGMGTIMSSFT